MTDRVEMDRLRNAGQWAAWFRALRQESRPTLRRADLKLPPPEHTSRDPWPEDFKLPGGAKTLERVAKAEGWTTRVRYARGYRWGVGANLIRVHSVAVVAWSPLGGKRAVVVWEAKVGDGKLTWSAVVSAQCVPGQLPAKVSVTALRDWIGRQP
jgi:hypothetical protein